MALSTCATCLRAVGPQEGLPCSGCRQACFCSSACLAAGQVTPWVHSKPICSAYARLAALSLPSEEAGQLRFLLHALALRHTRTLDSERTFATLMDLVGEPTDADRQAAARLGPLLASALPELVAASASAAADLEDVDLLASLLRKEQLNSYGVLAPSGAGPSSSRLGSSTAPGGQGGPGQEEVDGERRLRGSAMYAQASLINHECLPNVARFDNFDGTHPAASGPASTLPGGSTHPPPSTHVAFRALHDLPAGTELAQSYVPLHWGLAERQAQCREVYGFACTCPRCQTESQWTDDEGEADESEWETDSDGGGSMACDVAEAADSVKESAEGGGQEAEVEMQDAMGVVSAPPGEEGPLEPTYLRLFLLKYMCARPGCFGTAAPDKAGSALLECNVCGRKRSENEFLQELEKAQGKGRGAGSGGRC